jgi:hypothetical protein
MQYVIVRAHLSGVWAGYMHKREGKDVTLRNARRLYYWAGAKECVDLAMTGVSKPKECKFTAPATEVLVFEAIEIVKGTEKARESIESVAVWEE